MKNHPFVDGNKRVAVATLLGLAEMHNLNYPNDDELYDITIKVATNKLSVEVIMCGAKLLA